MVNTNVATNIWMWVGFAAFIVCALLLDSFVLTKKIKNPYESMRVSIYWTLGWIATALTFNLLLWLYLRYTTNSAFALTKALEFLTGYIIEKSLSIDNLFVFYLIFHQFHIPLKCQQRVFSIGIYSAIVLRLALILFGVWLINQFHWILYLLGVFLLLTGVKMFFTEKEKKSALRESPIFQFVKRRFRITNELQGERFFIVKNKLLYATPLVAVLIFIELSDIAFAFDSIPAILAITRDPFIVWASNIFAILGLRTLYFFIANMMERFHLLKYGIASILLFVGFKILFEPWVEIPAGLSLLFIIFVLFIFTLLSVATSSKKIRKQGKGK